MYSNSQDKATLRDWLGLTLLMLPTLVIAMDISVLHLAVPSISADLRPSSSQLLWITDIYGFMIAGSLITMGTLGDRIGRRKILMIGALAFGVASVLAAFSSSAELLILSRAFLGIAGATLMPSTISLIRNMFLDAQQRTVAIGIWASGFSVGNAIGPLVGGALLESFWWGSVFLISVPVMILLLIAGPVLLPEYRDPNPSRFDVPSAVLSVVAVLIFIYGIKVAAESGLNPLGAFAIVTGFVLAVIFVQRQRSLTHPLIDLELFGVPAFSFSLVNFMLVTFVAFGLFLLIAQYLQLVIGLSPLVAGIWTIPGAIAFVIGSNLAPKLVQFVQPATVIAGGLLLATIGLAMLIPIDINTFFYVVIGYTLIQGGGGFAYTITVDLVVSTAPPDRAGSASALLETGLELGGALGLAILGSLTASVYRAYINTASFVGISSEQIETAKDTIGSAISISNDLPDALGSDLLITARLGFTQGLQVSAIVGIVIFIVLVPLTFYVLREI